MKTIIAVALTIIMLVMVYSELRQEGYFRQRNSYNFPDVEVTVPVTPMTELDFLKKSEVYEIRRKAVREQPRLSAAGYEPTEEVFGQIVDGAAWWGIEGIFYYGPGKNSIAGPSEESRFLCNPYLPVGICEPNAYPLIETMYSLAPFPPVLKSIVWRPDRRVLVSYDVSAFLKGLRRYQIVNAHENKVTLVAYNARDFNLNWLALDEKDSRNVRQLAGAGRPALIRQFIHLGGSCGYPGGGNNMSPFQPELEITVSHVPATAVIHLWRDEPASATAPADLTEIIELQ